MPPPPAVPWEPRPVAPPPPSPDRRLRPPLWLEVGVYVTVRISMATSSGESGVNNDWARREATRRGGKGLKRTKKDGTANLHVYMYRVRDTLVRFAILLDAKKLAELWAHHGRRMTKQAERCGGPSPQHPDILTSL